MRWRSLAISAAALVAAGGITMTAHAAWTGGAAVDAGTLTAGSVSLVVGDGVTSAGAYTFSALDGANLAPGDARQAPLRITNDGTVALRYRSSGVDLGALAGEATVTWTRVASEAACPATGNPPALEGDITVARVLPPGAAETWCVRVTLGDDPPQNLAGQPVTFIFAAEQARHAG